MNKYTPGPWTFDEREPSGTYRVSNSNKHWVVAHVESETDAKLVAKTPEMLDLVKRAYLNIVSPLNRNDTVALFTDLRNILKDLKEL